MSKHATTRRTLLAAGIGSIGAIAGRLLGPLGTRAAEGDPLLMGVENLSGHATTLRGGGLLLEASERALSISSQMGVGLDVDAPDGIVTHGAIDALAHTQYRFGPTISGTAEGPRFTSINFGPDWPVTVGVVGTTETRVDPQKDFGPGDGVLGYADTGTGVFGRSNRGRGVIGESGETGTGVSGIADSGPPGNGASNHKAPPGTGVYGWGGSIGVFAARSWEGAVALQVAGKAQFNRSGKAIVAAGKSYADATVPDGLTARSVVHATLQTYRPGVTIAAVRANYPSAGKARIYLTKVASTTTTTTVGWFVAEF